MDGGLTHSITCADLNLKTGCKSNKSNKLHWNKSVQNGHVTTVPINKDPIL